MATFDQARRQGFGWEEVAASATCGYHDEGRISFLKNRSKKLLDLEAALLQATRPKWPRFPRHFIFEEVTSFPSTHNGSP
jgi:hypothetical protein